MQQILNFITTNYELIISGVLLVISVITFILRKRAYLIDNSATKTLINLVSEAENKYGSGHGSEKLSYVLKRYCELNNLPISNDILVVLKGIVEQILSTPQKK